MTTVAPLVIGLTVRNSTVRQVGNFRSEAQFDMIEHLKGHGYAVRVYDEQGISGADLSKRALALQMLDDLRHGEINGIAAYDVKRLTRDEFGVDGGMIARRIVEAGGLFVTRDRVYDLRNDDDLLQFQFQCMLAGIDWRTIRNTLWSGLFKKLEREPVYMRPPIGYMTEIAQGSGGSRVTKRVVKDPEQAILMDELGRLFNECDTLTEMARQLNTHGPARPAFNGRGGTTTHWSVQSLRYVLRNTIYCGTFTFGASLKTRSTVWHKYATDPETRLPKDFRQDVPELAYWTAADVRGWKAKFTSRGPTRIIETRHPHPLTGSLECMSCGGPMVARGPRNYACSALGTLRGKGSLPCRDPQSISPNVVAQILRRELPRAMHAAQAMAAELRAQQRDHKPSAAAQRLDFLKERAAWIREQLMTREKPILSLFDDLEKMEAQIASLTLQVAEEKAAARNDAELAAMCDTLLNSPFEAFDELPWVQQHRVFRLLFGNVRIETAGTGYNRRWRLVQYRALIGGQLRVLNDAPWCTRSNPRSKSLAFDDDMYQSVSRNDHPEAGSKGSSAQHSGSPSGSAQDQSMLQDDMSVNKLTDAQHSLVELRQLAGLLVAV